MSLKKNILNIVFFSLISLSLVSCGSFDFFKKSQEPVTSTDLKQDRISTLESELLAVKQEQLDSQIKIKEKDAFIKKLENDINHLTEKVNALEKARQSAKPVDFKIEYTTPAQLYKKARNLLLEEDYTNAATLFKKFIAAHPTDSLADNAVYWLGECYYSMKDYKKAILIFKNLENQYPKSEKVPDAILKSGYSYLSLDDTNRANYFLKKVIKEYPFSPASEKAQEKLKDFE
ncbi:MAG: tol-pal system protein YbgF [Pseudomonadota bacterium]